jgi:glycine/D-amino acid oxidase-like deaminating enzyme
MSVTSDVQPGAVRSGQMRNGGVSFWWSDLGGPATDRRPGLVESIQADVCIVGGGYTGLWTAYYLAKAAPELRVVVLEAEFCGYGASGRNGGWLSSLVPGPARRYGAGVSELRTAMQRSIDEVQRVTVLEAIDAQLVRGGMASVARTPAQLQRLRAHVALEHSQPGGDTDMQLLDAGELGQRIRIAGALGGSWTPHCARIHPARLVRGLAKAVERAGVRIYESTRASRISPGYVEVGGHAASGVGVQARWSIRATEGYTARLPGLRRTWLPMNSSMIATAPLPASAWEEIGWAGQETLGDDAHAYLYAQRTADGRIALGGRGVPYRYASRTDVDGATAPSTVADLTGLLHSLFPATRAVVIDHAWSGVLGVPRDWCATVGLDRETGLGWAGGYVGDGVTTSNLAGRTLTDLILDRESDLTAMPWVGRQPRQWEPEPARWLGVHGLYRAYRLADAREAKAAARGGSAAAKTSRIGRVADVIAGRT